jgi:Tol biopolymer transport system component
MNSACRVMIVAVLLVAWKQCAMSAEDDGPVAAPAGTLPFPVEVQVRETETRAVPTPFGVGGRASVAVIEDRLRRLERRIEALQSEVQSLRENLRRVRAAPDATRRGEPGFRALYKANRDGTDVEFLLAAPGMITTSDPNWSHDGRRLAMNGMPEVDAFGESRIFLHEFEGTNAGTTVDMGYGATPDWSPDDSQIAYMVNAANRGGQPGGLWVMDADGGNRRQLGNAWWPRWSPDGTKLCAHDWERGGTLTIYDVATGTARTLLKAPGWTLLQWGGTWSPDGQRIAFAGSYEGKHHFATIAADGSDESIRIVYTSDPAEQELCGPPFWSPDGRQVIFGMQEPRSSPRWFWRSYLYSMAADIRSAPVLLEGEKIGNVNRVVTWSPDCSKIIFSSER